MVLRICPRCNQRFITENNVIDFEHDCSPEVPAVGNEDVIVTGDWEDYTGSGEVTNALLQGAENKLWGTRAHLEGEDLDPLTQRGVSASTHRTRRHIEHIRLKGGANK